MGTEIFLISTSLFTGGAERQAIWLANALSKSGYKVNLLILKKGDELSHLVNKDINLKIVCLNSDFLLLLLPSLSLLTE